MAQSVSAVPRHPTAEHSVDSDGWLRRLRKRAPVSSALVLLFFVGLLAVRITPDAIVAFALISSEATQVRGAYRFFTYAFLHPQILDWLVVSAITLVAGRMAEPWLSVRAMWGLVGISAIVSGVIFISVVRVPEAAVGGGFIAAGVAGGAVASAISRRRVLGRGTQLGALALLVLYGLAPLRATPSSLAMFGAFVVGAAFTRWQMRRPVVQDLASAA